MNNSLKVTAFIVLVVVSIAGFASLIPQLESPAPEVIEISGDLSGLELAAIGEGVILSADAGCLACHGLGSEGLRAPDLAGIGAVAGERVAGLSAAEYLRESLVDPCAFVVSGYDCIMPQTLLQTLGETKITSLTAFLESQGGEVTVSLSADVAESAEAEAPSDGGGLGVAGSTGDEIMASLACGACHTLDALGLAGAVGPDLSVLGARLTPSQIRESILTPDTVIAEDCPPGACAPGVMPKTFGDQLSAAQLESLVTFLSEQGGPLEEGSAAIGAEASVAEASDEPAEVVEPESEASEPEPAAEEAVAEVVEAPDEPEEEAGAVSEASEPEPPAEEAEADSEPAASPAAAAPLFPVDPNLLLFASIVATIVLTVGGGVAMALFFVRGHAAMAEIEAAQPPKKKARRTAPKKPANKAQPGGEAGE